MKPAGVLFFLSGCVVLMGITTAEIFYPVPYSVVHNMISNLGSTPPPGSIIYQTPATIFDNSMKLAGILVLLGTSFLYSVTKDKRVFSIALLGLGTLGVGIFPAFHATAHPISAGLAFFGGGVAAIVTSKFVKPPFSLITILLGSISLVFLFLGLIFPQFIVPILGKGGTERWVAFPIILWLTSFGGYLMSNSTKR